MSDDFEDDDFADFDARFQDLKRRFDEREPMWPGKGRAEFEAQRREAEAAFEAESGESHRRFQAEGGRMDQEALKQGQDHQKQLTAMSGEEQGLGRRYQQTRSRLGQFKQDGKDALVAVLDTEPSKRFQGQWRRIAEKARQFRRGREDHPALPAGTLPEEDD